MNLTCPRCGSRVHVEAENSDDAWAECTSKLACGAAWGYDGEPITAPVYEAPAPKAPSTPPSCPVCDGSRFLIQEVGPAICLECRTEWSPDGIVLTNDIAREFYASRAAAKA